MENIVLEFTHNHGIYHKGVIAHFPRKAADELVAMGVAVIKEINHIELSATLKVEGTLGKMTAAEREAAERDGTLPKRTVKSVITTK